MKDNTERTSNYVPFLDELKTNGITMPMRLQQIPKFENMNDLTINVNRQIILEVIFGLYTFQKEEEMTLIIFYYYVIIMKISPHLDYKLLYACV